jgi:hypothetical protein|uniref:Uncharacterized protein n=1 Tax=Caudovirales sp. ctTqA28 TaxID=2826775 RepID=A0A8S5MD83_9CAUD|nr:MAG TPA: hypothetical protein [Caudovirales sp. ctTqA28]
MAKLVNEQPTSGHFVAVWVFGGSVWSDTFEYIDGRLHRYCQDVDEEWCETGNNNAIPPQAVAIAYYT